MSSASRPTSSAAWTRCGRASPAGRSTRTTPARRRTASRRRCPARRWRRPAPTGPPTPRPRSGGASATSPTVTAAPAAPGRTRSPTTGTEGRRRAADSRLGHDLDGRDLELERHLLADQDPAGLQRGVPLHAPVPPVHARRPLEPQPDVAVGVLGGAGVLEVDADRLGRPLDGEVARHPERLVVDPLHAG